MNSPIDEAVRERTFLLRKVDDDCTAQRWAINDLSWHDITEFPVLGSSEVWSFYNQSGVPHPMHMHLVFFQILDRQAFTMSNNVPVPTGPRMAPHPGEAGWKDTVHVQPYEIVRVIARFEDYTGKYPYHCHVLEHEDHEMMRQFEVVLPPKLTAIRRAGTNIAIEFRPADKQTNVVERKNQLAGAPWLQLTNSMPENGSNIMVIDPGAATASNRFYRIRVP